MYSQLQIQQFVPLAPPPRDETNYINHHRCADDPAAADGEVGRALLSSCLAPFPPVRRDLVEKTSLEVRPTSQLAPLPSLGEKVRRPPLPPLLPPPPTILAALAAAPDNNTRGKRRHNINCVATAACQRQVTRTHAVTTDRKSQGGRLVLTLPLTIFDRHPRHCAARHPQQQH